MPTDYERQQAALQQANASINQANKQAFGGITGWFTRLFMGKRFTQDMQGVMAEGQASIAQAQGQLAQQQMQQQALAQGVGGFAAPNPYGAQPGYGPPAAGQWGPPAGGGANDPAMQPIQGISLDRYADLGAAIADLNNDPNQIAQVLQREGVNPADFEAAKMGWTARMQDMSLMGRVATAYMPLYQAALARRKGGSANMSYEDFVAVSAAIKVFGFEAAVQASGISQSEWTEVAAQWNGAMSREMPRFVNHPGFIGQEEARLRAGGQPKRVQVTRGGGPAPATAPPMAQPAPPAAAPVGGVVPGSRVLVAWTDGKQYAGQVHQVAQGQCLVALDGGSAPQWVPQGQVRPA